MTGRVFRSRLPMPAAKRLRQIQADARIADFTGWCARNSLPVPTPEYRFCAPRRWRFDWCWLQEMVALEVEGGIWTRGRHNRGPGMLADMEKYSEAAILGWCVLRTTPRDLCSSKTLVMLHRAFARYAEANATSRNVLGVCDAAQSNELLGGLQILKNSEQLFASGVDGIQKKSSATRERITSATKNDSRKPRECGERKTRKNARG